MKGIDPRLAERRRAVAEDRARRTLRRLLRVLMVAGAAGGLVWLAFSPLLSVAEVRSTGVVVSSAYATLAEHGMVVGTPMIRLRPSAVESALEQDPWIADASVTLDWPDLVIVEVTERSPIAWVETRDGWARRSHDGTSLPSPDQPDETLARVSLPELPDDQALESEILLGALEFVANLNRDLQLVTVVTTETDGELWAEVAGYRVRLGRPVEMRAKALSLTALLREQPPAGSTLILIAPANPAVSPANEGEGAGADDDG